MILYSKYVSKESGYKNNIGICLCSLNNWQKKIICAFLVFSLVSLLGLLLWCWPMNDYVTVPFNNELEKKMCLHKFEIFFYYTRTTSNHKFKTFQWVWRISILEFFHIVSLNKMPPLIAFGVQNTWINDCFTSDI